jgi:hypothetical protein
MRVHAQTASEHEETQNSKSILRTRFKAKYESSNAMAHIQGGEGAAVGSEDIGRIDHRNIM